MSNINNPPTFRPTAQNIYNARLFNGTVYHNTLPIPLFVMVGAIGGLAAVNNAIVYCGPVQATVPVIGQIYQSIGGSGNSGYLSFWVPAGWYYVVGTQTGSFTSISWVEWN